LVLTKSIKIIYGGTEMKKNFSILMVLVAAFIFVGCDNDPKDSKDSPTVTDSDGSVYEAFEYNVGLYQLGYKEGWTEDDNNEQVNGAELSWDNTDANGKGAAKVTIDWTTAVSYGGKSYLTLYSDGGTNAENIDGTGKTMVVKIKCPDNFLDGYDPDENTADDEIFPGIKLYVKGTSWGESSLWIGAWNIKDALDGNDQSDAGVTVDAEEGFVLLKAVIGTDISPVDDNGDASVIYESGVVFEQNADQSLTDDMAFYIDYIDFE